MMTTDEDLLDEIRAACKGEYAPRSKSVADRLVETGWCRQEDLILAYQDLQKPDTDRTILFFQLPFLMRLPDTWIKVRSEYGNPYLRFRTIPHNSTLDNASDTNTTTQVLASFQLWERRRRLYVPYLEGIRNGQRLVKTKLKSGGVLDVLDFQQNVLHRLILQAIDVLREFIPVYKVTCKDPVAETPDKLSRAFMMVKTGRLVVKDSTETSKRKPVSEDLADYKNNLTSLRKRLQSSRRPSIYETYLLEAARQIEAGSHNLAIVQTVMILDWFANEIIVRHLFEKLKKSLSDAPSLYELAYERMWERENNEKLELASSKELKARRNEKRKIRSNDKKTVTTNGKLRVGVEEKFRKYLPVVGVHLTSQMKGQLKDLVSLRNQIVHRTQVIESDREIALIALETGMSILSSCMEQLLHNTTLTEKINANSM